MKKILLIINLLLSHLLFSQAIFKFKIKKEHEYNIYSNESLQLILDKSDSTYFFTYLPDRNGDMAIMRISEGRYLINKRNITFISKNTQNYNSEMLGELRGLRFKIKTKKIIPIIDPTHTSYDIIYFAKPLFKIKIFKEYPNLVYQEK